MDDKPADNLSNQSTPPTIPDVGNEPSTPQPTITPEDIKTDPPTISGIDIPSPPSPPPPPPPPLSPPPPPPTPEPQTPEPQIPLPPPPAETPPPKTEPESFTVSEKKQGSPVIVAGALVILLMAATLPAGISLVQTQTQISSRAKEGAVLPSPTPKSPKTQTTHTPLTVEDQQSDWVNDLKPQNVKITTPSKGTAQITFTTNQAFLSTILYSPDENWNYLTMFLQENYGLDEWENYQPTSEKLIEPKTSKEPTTNHEFILENLISGQKYLVVIQIEVPEQKEIFEFGLEQPEHYYTFTAK